MNDDELQEILSSYGTKDKVKHTVQRILEHNTFDEFSNDYPFVTHINPHSIKDIVENYYTSKKQELTSESPPTGTLEITSSKIPEKKMKMNCIHFLMVLFLRKQSKYQI